MFSDKDYTNMSLEELRTEAQKMEKQTIPMALGVGFLFGIAVYSATHGGGFLLTVLLLVFALQVGGWHGKTKEKIKAEISRRDAN